MEFSYVGFFAGVGTMEGGDGLAYVIFGAAAAAAALGAFALFGRD